MGENKEYDLYNDISKRTNGEIYIGVVGPVRSGKSTFIKRFMDLLVIPGMTDVNSRERAIDELPQSADGRTIMTTEPKFIPKEAATVKINDDCELKVRLIDCVGFMVEGATGHIENEQERMVNTPWSEESIPFSLAAEIGTRKVINDHSTIGIVITSDGSFGELKRTGYMEAERTAINEMKKIGKPFVVLLNSSKPYSEDTKTIANEISIENSVTAIPVNCEQLHRDDITRILRGILMEFPVSRIDYYIPKWVEMLPADHELKQNLINNVRENMNKIDVLKDVNDNIYEFDSPYIKSFQTLSYSPENGRVEINIEFDDSYYYQIISELTGTDISSEYQLIATLKELAGKKNELVMLGSAFERVSAAGYGVVEPSMKDIIIEEPEIIKHGSKFGVKIKAVSPSIHMIKANIETEIAPIVGTEEQAEGLIRYIRENEKNNPEGIWDTNIFGKTIRQLVEDGIQGKINKLTEESQMKLQDTIQKVINDSNGGLICIII